MGNDFDLVTAKIAYANFKTWSNDGYTRVLRETANKMLLHRITHTGAFDALRVKLDELTKGMTTHERGLIDGMVEDALFDAARGRS